MRAIADMRTLGLCLLVALARPALGQQSSDAVVDRVVHDACGKRVVLLGEPPMHGLARTLELKTEIARQLVKRCGFNAFFIESGAYDFLAIRTKLAARQPVTQSMVEAAIGGLWAVKEVEPLLPLLVDGAQDGTLVLGGLDDQLGRGTYAQLQMPADLSEVLSGGDKVRCLAILQRHTLWQYTNDAQYGAEDKARILDCVDKIGVKLRTQPASVGRDDAMAMLDNLRRLFARDFRATPAAAGQDFNDRDASMYENFKWWNARLPRGSKVIVWTATTHAAKNFAGVEGFTSFVPLGNHIRRGFNGQAFVLGFSALAGTFALGRQPSRTLVAAPGTSLEVRTFEGSGADVRYLDGKALSQLGLIAGRPLGVDFKTTRWSEVVDALVVFRQEHPPSASAPPSASGQQPPITQQASADPLNLGFERTGLITPNAPANWYVGGPGYAVSVDTVNPQSGKRSLRMQSTTARRPGSFGVATGSLPGSAIAGKTIKLRGFIRTEGVSPGYAGLWLRIDSGMKMLVIDNMSSRGVTGTTGWAQYEISLNAAPSATGANFGALLPGEGTAWFDSFSIEIDGKPYAGEAAPVWQATTAEANWVKSHAIPLATSDPNAPLDDLRPIGAIVGDARIVELGEGTHGTSEFFQMKHRLTEFLAQEKGFTVFAIEANMPEARRVNEYVLTGRGDPKAALAGLYFWTWNTQEVLDLIEWMRRYNASGKGRMEFWGFDLQTPNVAIDSVRAFMRRADTAFIPSLDTAYGRIGVIVQERLSNTLSAIAAGDWESEAERVLAHLETSRDSYVKAGRDTLEVAWAIQHARIVLQAARSTRGSASRDSSMAVNVQWIAAHQPPGTKMVLWAHNGHVAREPNWMGAHLAARYGDAMRVIGFSLGEGEFTAVGPRGLSAYPAAPPQPGTLEEVFRATGIPQFALDLRGVTNMPDATFLSGLHNFRSIGAVASDNQFFPARVARQFDVLIYFDHTKPSVRLNK